MGCLSHIQSDVLGERMPRNCTICTCTVKGANAQVGYVGKGLGTGPGMDRRSEEGWGDNGPLVVVPNGKEVSVSILTTPIHLLKHSDSPSLKTATPPIRL